MLKVTANMGLSLKPLCPNHRSELNSKEKKLMSTLHDKQKYVIHYNTLKQAVELRMVITKIYKAIRFRQKPWLKPYIDFNSNKRKNAKNEFKKRLLELMTNTNNERTLENQRKHVIIRLISCWNGRYGAEAFIFRQNFKNCSTFSENFVAVELSPTEISIWKPVVVGLSVLDLSKMKLFRFYYKYIFKQICDNAKLLYMYTDSQIYEIENENIYEMIK